MPNTITLTTPQVINSPVKGQTGPKTVQTPQQTVVTPQKVNARTGGTLATSAAKTPLTSKQSQQQANHENEQNAQEWLRSTYELGDVAKDRMDMQELYKLYVTSMSKLKRGGVVSPAFFPKVVKLVFGANTGPVKDQGPPFYTGIRLKPQSGAATAPMQSPKTAPVQRVVVSVGSFFVI